MKISSVQIIVKTSNGGAESIIINNPMKEWLLKYIENMYLTYPEDEKKQVKVLNAAL